LADYEVIFEKYVKSKKRKKHCVSTALFMKKYARHFGINEESAYLSGLIHDLGKELSVEEILEFSDSFIKRGLFEVKYVDFKKRFPFLLHGVASAEIMISELGISNISLLSSAVFHTTGGVNLDKLSKFTFLADFCEPTREFKEAKIVHKLITKKRDFDRAYFFSYRFIIEDLIRRMVEICPDSIEGYNEALSFVKINS